MRRISTATRVVNKFGAGKDGFTNGDAVGGIAATDLEDVWFDHVQEEIANAIELSGQTLSNSDRTQLSKAFKGRLLRTSVYTLVGGVQMVSVNGGAFTATGASTWAPLSQTSTYQVTGSGSGGGGGGAVAVSAGQTCAASAGGAGAYAVGIYNTVASQTVTIGAPGVGGVPSVSGATVGATCSFGSLMTLPGGTIGVNVAVSAFSVGSGNSASPSGSNLIVSMPGQGGGNASGTAGTSAFSGVSGNNPLGIGDISHVSAVGATGNGYGSGGGGAAQSGGANAARNGGNGAPGAFIVQEFS
ncbi:hypothetical protein BSFA1_42040 [Burkholderia sp. SFA1]|nr:hypothetical protein BSFA1_42040 [Burkholderia sp. SFA1]